MPESTPTGKLPHDVTRLIQAATAGDQPASKQLFDMVYDRLRTIAQQRMAGERTDHTLGATALVHEAYLRLVGDADLSWAARVGFYHAAAEAMRHILIDHARQRDAAKRGKGRPATDLSSVIDLAADPDPDQIVAFDGAFLRLQEEAPDAAAVVRLRFFAGLSVEQAALALGISARSVAREWNFARAWLYRYLTAVSGR